MNVKSWMWGLAAVVATACGGAGSGGADSQVQAYEAARAELASAVTTYAQEAGTATADACETARARYANAAGPALERMSHMSGELGGHGMMGGGMGATGMTPMAGADDLACGAGAMAAELARHEGVPCTGDAVQDGAERARHVCAMGGWLEEQRLRCRAMQGDGNGPAASCQLQSDGTYAAGACTGCTDGSCPGCGGTGTAAAGTCPDGSACPLGCGGMAVAAP